MTGTHNLLQIIREGIEDKKGEKIVILNLSKLENAICNYFIICEGGSNTHVDAIAGSVEQKVKADLNENPIAVEGASNAYWVALDYGDVMVHVFQREPRSFYDLEGLWEDGIKTEIES